jgi:integrase
MRLTEALNLRFEDIDWAHGVLTICRAKFQKSRLVPLHKSALRELRTYIDRRNQLKDAGERVAAEAREAGVVVSPRFSSEEVARLQALARARKNLQFAKFVDRISNP